MHITDRLYRSDLEKVSWRYTLDLFVLFMAHMMGKESPNGHGIRRMNET